MAGVSPAAIAIIGMSCRLPGGVHSPEEMWKVLSENQDTWTEVPSSRYNWKSFFHPDLDAQGAFNHRGGHFLTQDIGVFDPSFFGIPPTEAAGIDPQQRILLETAFEALESAGLPLERVHGSNTGVFIATFSHDYDIMGYKDTNDIHKSHLIGTGTAIVANRISYIFDLKGPSFSLDTGCSGGMVALHQACQSLQTNESEMALVGGTNLILSPDMMVPMNMISVLNKDGKCYSFDSRGSGYGRGEGVACLVLKRLEDAVQANDPIRAVIRGTGINQDGKTTGITLPSQEAQENLIGSIYHRCELQPQDTQYVEAHGTGTIVGDVTEFRSIRNVFRGGSHGGPPIYIGSVKANFGHLESTSGIAAIIKTTMMIEKGQIPANIKFKNPKLGLGMLDGSIEIPTRLIPWPKVSVRRASVNNFGYGGTNAHAILESIENPARNQDSEINGLVNGHSDHGHRTFPIDPNGTFADTSAVHASCHVPARRIFNLTANSEMSLKIAVRKFGEWLKEQKSDDYLEDLAYTLSTRRSILRWRWTTIAATHRELLDEVMQEQLSFTKAVSTPCLVFLFTGQGAQWFAMGRQLISAGGSFKESIKRSDEILRSLGASWSLLEELLKDMPSSRINQSEISQPATTAIQIALVGLMGSLSIKPSAVLGHSSGEIAAAFAAGKISHEAAMTVSYHRSFISKWTKEIDKTRRGAMLAVGLGPDDATRYIASLKLGTVTIACVNSPSSTTISGDEAAIDELHSQLHQSSIFSRKLQVDTAYHSHHMAAVAEKYLAALNEERIIWDVKSPYGVKSIKSPNGVNLYSSVSGNEKTSGFESSYWVENLVSRVCFRDALQSLCSAEPDKMHLFVEIGPHSALSAPVRQTFGQTTANKLKYTYHSALLRDRNSLDTVLDVARKLFENGYPVNIGAANSLEGSLPDHILPGGNKRKVITDLPPYSWDHSKAYWHESRLSIAHRLRHHAYHDLLGLRVISGNSVEPLWRNLVSTSSHPWLRDHVIDNFPIFPGSGYLCMAIEAARQLIQDRKLLGKVRTFRLRDIIFSKALAIPDGPESVEIQLSMKIENKGEWNEFRIFSLPTKDGTWSENCHGYIRTEFENHADEVERDREEQLTAIHYEKERTTIKAACQTEINSQKLYSELRKGGNAYGPNFAVVKSLCIGGCLGFGQVIIPDIADSMPSAYQQPHLIHPSTLDAIMHSGLPVYMQESDPQSAVPVSIKELVVLGDICSVPGHDLEVAIKVTPSANFHVTAYGTDENSNRIAVVSINHLQVKIISDVTRLAAEEERHPTYKMILGEDVDYLDPKYFEQLQRCSDDLPKHNNRDLDDDRQLLNQAATIYVGLCLERMEKSSLTISRDHYIKFYSWMNRFWNSDAARSLAGGLSTDDKKSCLQKVQNAGVLGEVLSQIGPQLTSILTEEVHPLTLLLENDLLSRLYSEDVSSNHCYLHMKDYLKLLAFKNPHMAILEVGAGTGGATVPLLQSLVSEPKQSGGAPLLRKYDFTDVSTGFFEKGRILLEEWAEFVQFKVLDLESSPTIQGFAEASYDLIIASNVIHATKLISKTLSNIRKLLKPGGRLILIEVTRNNPAVNVTSGVHEGWWAGFDDGRKDAPLLSTEQWETALKDASFDGIEIVANDWNGPAHMSSMIVSRTKPPNSDAIPSALNIILPPNATELQDFAAKVAHASGFRGFHSCVMHDFPDEVMKESLYVVIDDSKRPLLADPSYSDFQSVSRLLVDGRFVLWISAQTNIESSTIPEKSLITGLVRVARRENGELKVATLDVQQSVESNIQTGTSNWDQPPSDFIDGLVDVILKLILSVFYEQMRSEDSEYVYKSDKTFIPRLVPTNELDKMEGSKQPASLNVQPFHQPDRPLRLEVETPGLLDSLKFVDDNFTTLGDDEVEVEAKAFGVNFKDVFVALGQMSPEMTMVGECAGVVVSLGINARNKFKVGDRVCGYGAGSPFASRPRINFNAMHRLPDTISFSEGASIPVVFSTAYIGLIELGRLKKGQSVFIPSGSGGVGQAAIMIAQHIGAEIFTTVSSSSKRQLLIEQHNIPESQIFSSQLGTYKWGILRLTQRKGVDVCLSALAGQARSDALECVASFGTFVEIGKSNGEVSMEPFEKNITLSSLDLTVFLRHRPDRLAPPLDKIIEMFETKELRPVYPLVEKLLNDIESAFRLIQGRKHTGKIVLIADEQVSVKATPAARIVPALNAHSTYLVAGGLGSIGEKLCRMLAAHGARHILILSRNVGQNTPERRSELEKYLCSLNCNLYLMRCDITNITEVRTVMENCKRALPVVRGIMQCVFDVHDTPLESMSVKMYNKAVLPKLYGTKNLDQVFQSPDLDFFVMLSSVVSILGCTGQANYAAGGTYQDALATNNKSSDTSYISLNISLMKGSDQETAEREKAYLRQGAAALDFSEILPLLEYSISRQGQADPPKQLIIGIHIPSLLDPTYNPSAIFSHILTAASQGEHKEIKRPLENLEEMLVAAKTLDESQAIISSAIAKKISTLIAIQDGDVGLKVPMADFGFDSLVSIELKNWISRTLKAAMQSSEIQDATNISELAKTVATRSRFVNITRENSSETEDKRPMPLEPSHKFKCCQAAEKLKTLPLLDLDTIIDSYLTNVEHFCTELEFEKATKAAMEFKEPGSIGQTLYGRLAARAKDPELDNWLSQIYLEACYLHRRYPLAPFSNFVLSHFATEVPHTQVERAVVIAIAALEFKTSIERDTVEPQYLNESLLCKISHGWLFSTVREPGIGCDQMRRYETQDYCVVLRRGHAFKVILSDTSGVISFSKLRATFELIMRAVDEDSWVGILTADYRDSWAQIRLNLRTLSPSNQEYIKVVEEATFLICLDDGTPTTAPERINQFLMNNGFNRWNDKSLQFIVCSNGVSGVMVEHSMIDGIGIKQLSDHIAKAIKGHRPEHVSKDETGHSDIHLEEYALITTPVIDGLISNIRTRFIGDVSRVEFNSLTMTTLPLNLLQAHKCPTKSIFEVIIQVGSRKFFGYSPASWQPVSMEHYHKGRPEIVQTCTKEIFEFCNAIYDDDVLASAKRRLLFEAAKSNAISISRAQRALGYGRIFQALEHVLQDDDPMPSLFEDETFKKTGPNWIMTGAPDLQVSEGGFVLQNLGSLWVQYYVQETEVRFSIMGPKGRTAELIEYLNEAAQTVRLLLDS